MAIFIDSRQTGGINAENRERLKDRYKHEIKEQIKKMYKESSIKDLKGEKKVVIPGIDSEPSFGYDYTNTDIVMVGNKKYKKGDRRRKPIAGEGGQPGGSLKGEGFDPFEFTLTADEFRDLLFEELEIPYLKPKENSDIVEYKYKHVGFQSHGLPSNIDISRSWKNSLGRQIAMEAMYDAEIDSIKTANKTLDDCDKEQILELEYLRSAIPFLDDIDLRYRFRAKVPQPITKAVMICVMDVSGSMDEVRKDLAKRFYLLLYLFLTTYYERFEIVFIRHHDQAYECDEKAFFHDPATGGTVVSPALTLAKKIIDERYPIDSYNIYVVQASDGENYAGDDERCRAIFETLLPAINYYLYIQIGSFYSSNNLPDLYVFIKELTGQYKHCNMATVTKIDDVYPEFVKQFKRKEGEDNEKS